MEIDLERVSDECYSFGDEFLVAPTHLYTQFRFMTAMFKLGICHFFLCFYIPMAIPDSMQKELKNFQELIF